MPRRLPSLTALRVFEAAARLQSFKSAARELHVTPAAVTRQIKELERALGFTLFDRMNRKVLITDRGSRYAAVVRRAFDDIASMTRDLVEGSKRASRLTLLVEREFASRWLLPKLRDFNDRQPDVDVEIVPATEVAGLPIDGAHGAITYGELAQPGIRLECLLSLHAFPVCSPHLVAGEHPLREPEDLVHYRLLHEVSTEWWKRWLTAAGVTGVDWSAGHIFHEATLALEAALAEEGVAMGDNLLALRELEAGRLVKLFPQACPTGSYYLATWRNAVLDPTLAVFREWLLSACAEQQLRCDRWR